MTAGAGQEGMAMGFKIIGAAAFSAAALGMFVALRIQRARGRPRTRFVAWLGAVASSSLVFAAVFIFGLTRMPAGSLRKMPEHVRSIRDTMTVEIPPVLERMAGGKERIKAQQELTRGVVDSPAFIWWTMFMGTSLTSLFFGAVVGTVAWGGAMGIGRVFLRRWPLGAVDGFDLGVEEVNSQQSTVGDQ